MGSAAPLTLVAMNLWMRFLVGDRARPGTGLRGVPHTGGEAAPASISWVVLGGSMPCGEGTERGEWKETAGQEGPVSKMTIHVEGRTRQEEDCLTLLRELWKAEGGCLRTTINKGAIRDQKGTA